MALSSDEIEAITHIMQRLASDDPVQMRSGGRAAAAQAIEQRLGLVRALRPEIGALIGGEADEHRRGYYEALQDTLLITEVILEPRETEARARQELAAAPMLQKMLDLIAGAPMTASEAAKASGMDAAQCIVHMNRLHALGLLTVLSTAAGLESPHVATTIGERLARPVEGDSRR